MENWLEIVHKSNSYKPAKEFSSMSEEERKKNAFDKQQTQNSHTQPAASI